MPLHVLSVRRIQKCGNGYVPLNGLGFHLLLLRVGQTGDLKILGSLHRCDCRHGSMLAV